MGRKRREVKPVEAAPVKAAETDILETKQKITETPAEVDIVTPEVNQEVVEESTDTKVEDEPLVEVDPEPQTFDVESTKTDEDTDTKVEDKPKKKIDIKLIKGEEDEGVKVQITITPHLNLSKKILELKKNPKYKFLSKNILIRIAQKALGK